ncbi:hypothetical protein BGX20_008058 [Mortierella sp. AD010]|nr:hypothetical protein BGX20_008058 [Mortierella sp. AD010]
MVNLEENKKNYCGSSVPKNSQSSPSTRDIPTRGKDVSKPVSSSSSVRATPRDDVIDIDDTSIDEITAVAMCSPFSHLVMKLYKLYGHTPIQFNPPVRFPTDTMGELYHFAEKIIDNWHSSCKIDQKNCLVALSGILNTMDADLEPHFTEFSDVTASLIEKELFTISGTQKTIFSSIKEKLGGGTMENLHALRRYCSRCRDDLEERMLMMDVGQRQSQREEHKIMQIMEFICEEIIFMQRISKSSEHEDVSWWRGIARILYEHDLVVRVGELGSSSTRNDRTEIESSFGGTESNVRARKIDILHQLCMQGVGKPLELLSWEAKPKSASDETLQTQLRKNIRTNASIMKSLMPYLDRSFPQPSPMVLDIVGPRALVYTVRKIESGVFGAGLIGERMIEIPMHADDIAQFLDGGSMSALIRVGCHNTSFADLIKQGYRKAQNEAAMAKITKRLNIREDGPPIIFTPTKKRQKQQGTEVVVDYRKHEEDFAGAWSSNDYE